MTAPLPPGYTRMHRAMNATPEELEALVVAASALSYATNDLSHLPDDRFEAWLATVDARPAVNPDDDQLRDAIEGLAVDLEREARDIDWLTSRTGVAARLRALTAAPTLENRDA